MLGGGVELHLEGKDEAKPNPELEELTHHPVEAVQGALPVPQRLLHVGGEAPLPVLLQLRDHLVDLVVVQVVVPDDLGKICVIVRD